MTPTEIPFRATFPAEFFEKADAGEGRTWRVGGIITTEHEDRQGETVLQRGLDFGDLIERGYINDNHGRDTANVLGIPVAVEPCVYKGKPATRMEGYLLQDRRAAKDVWELARSLQGHGRSLYWSIEGKIQRRMGAGGKTIAKAAVREVALTKWPVNPHTNVEVLAKSLADFERALAAGSAIEAPAATPGEGFPLRTEQVDPGVRSTTYGGAAPKKNKKRHRRQQPPMVGKAEAAAIILRQFPDASWEQVGRIWQLAAA